jgi:SAM-dependent methyltransferase
MTMTTAHDARIVAQFTRWARPFADLPLHSETDGMARLRAAAGATAETRVLDVACGPGIVSCALAKEAAHVTGVDLTPAMIDQARARQLSAGLEAMDWQVGDATALPFPDESFDLVVTRYSLHHIPEPARALAEMRRVCRRGGRILVADATPAPEVRQAYDQMETLRDPSHASALTQAELRGLGREAGLTERVVDFHRLEAQLATLADEGDMAALEAMFDADIASGEDRIGVAAWRADDGIRFLFPISIIAWERVA